MLATAAPRTPISRVNMNSGSRMMFSTKPAPIIFMGRTVSPSPVRMARKLDESTMNTRPKQKTWK